MFGKSKSEKEVMEDSEIICEEILEMITNNSSDPRIGTNKLEKIKNYFDDIEKKFVNPRDKHEHQRMLCRSFTRIWLAYIDKNHWEYAKHIWRNIVIPQMIEWESENSPKRIHKGTAYYWWGITEIMSGDVDKGYLLMHQSFTEDKISAVEVNRYEENCKTNVPDTPAHKFVNFEFDQAAQARIVKDWLSELAQYVEARIEDYTKIYNSNYDIGKFKTNFLSNKSLVELVYFFSHTAAKFKNFYETENYLLDNIFAAQFMVNIIFDMATVVESTIKNKNQNTKSLADSIHFLLKKLGQTFNGDPIAFIKKQLQNGITFDKIVVDILDNKFIYPKRKTGLSPIQKDSLIMYVIRNHVGHNVDAGKLLLKRHREIQTSIFNMFFVVIENLYP